MLIYWGVVRPSRQELRTAQGGAILNHQPSNHIRNAPLAADGWLRTGDAARSDEQGYVWIVDRMAACFVSDGRHVYPGDVERVLTSHPSIADAGVVQVLGEGGGEVVAALVVLSAGSAATEQEILAFGRRHLAAHQAPTLVMFVDRLPRNSVGKLLRAQLPALISRPDPT